MVKSPSQGARLELLTVPFKTPVPGYDCVLCRKSHESAFTALKLTASLGCCIHTLPTVHKGHVLWTITNASHPSVLHSMHLWPTFFRLDSPAFRPANPIESLISHRPDSVSDPRYGNAGKFQCIFTRGFQPSPRSIHIAPQMTDLWSQGAQNFSVITHLSLVEGIFAWTPTLRLGITSASKTIWRERRPL